jgi:cold shock CspA family protein
LRTPPNFRGVHMDGFISRFNEYRGFGFITPMIGAPRSANDVFFHVSALTVRRTCPVGARVSFKLVDGRKGPQACDIVIKPVNGNELLRDRNEKVYEA